MYESILRRSARAGADGTRWRDVSRRCRDHLSRQPVVYQTLASAAYGCRSSPSQAPDWTPTSDWPYRRSAATPQPHLHSRRDLARTGQYLDPRARPLTQPLDDESSYQAPALVAKKKTLTASERDPWLRAHFQVQIADLNAHDLVVVDEFGCNLDLTRCYSWAPIGTRAAGSLPRNTPPNQTVIASLQLSGMGPSMHLAGGTDTAAFAAYIEHFLGPTLRCGQTVLVDNLSAHTAPKIGSLLAARGCRLWFLPPYSPDFSPIELAFAKIKTILRSIGARSIETLEQAIAAALGQITAADAAAFFRHCGYWVPSPMAQAFCT